jgi:pimeloyl-ACP methyl ester carboxylesterase
VILFDEPGHGNNTSPFSFARAEACAAGVIEALQRKGEIDLARTVLVGHSLGGGIAILMGTRFEVAGTIVVAPAPETLLNGLPPNLLVLSPQFDVPLIKQMERNLAEWGRGRNDSAAEFAARRAFREIVLKGRTHAGAIFDTGATLETARWAARCLGTALSKNYTQPWGGFLGGLLGFAGLGFVFPLLASLLARGLRLAPAEEQTQAGRPLEAVVYWTFSGVAAMGILVFCLPLPIHVYSGDYLVSMLAIASVPLLIFLSSRLRSAPKPSAISLLMAAMLAVVTFTVFGAWMNWQLTDAWMNAARWARFPLIAVVLLPYSLAEETALGPPVDKQSGGRFRRFSLYLLLRFILWFAAAYAVFTGLSSAVLVVFFVVVLGLFSIGQRLGADAVRRRTCSPAAAAVFSAILGAWFVAAAFPTT